MEAQLNTLHTGIITLVNSNGIGVRLDDLGIEGYAMLAPREGTVKAHFDSRRLSLTIEEKTYCLDQKIHVMINQVDIEKRKILLETITTQTAERLSAWM
jgi:exoribonuclease II